MSIKRIVVGVDGGDGGAGALRWAADLAGPIRAEIIVIHAITPQVSGAWTTAMGGIAEPMPTDEEWSTWRDSEERRIDRQARALLRPVQVPFRVIVVEGQPATVIMETARTEDADLIVVGRRGRGGLAELVLGSVSHHLTHHAGRPVVVVPPVRDHRILHLEPETWDRPRHHRLPAQLGGGAPTPSSTGRAS